MIFAEIPMMLKLAFLFFVGSIFGWVLELFYRRFFSLNNPERKWINPGFCTGPYLPIYGLGLCALYLIAGVRPHIHFGNEVLDNTILLLAMTFAMTMIEYIAGVVSYKGFHVRLWDYSEEWGNIKGIICPKFSLFWGLLGVAYYYLVHPDILDALNWLAHNLACSFFIGEFFGVFIIDLVHSAQLITKIKKIADENDVVVRYEELKNHIHAAHEERQAMYHFFRPFETDTSLAEHIKAIKASHEDFKNKIKAAREG